MSLSLATYACKYTTSKSLSNLYYRSFSSFLHSTCALSVIPQYLGLPGDSVWFKQNYTTYYFTFKRKLTLQAQTNIYGAITFCGVETPFLYSYVVTRKLCASLAYLRIRSPLLTESNLVMFFQLMRCFNSLDLLVHAYSIYRYIYDAMTIRSLELLSSYRINFAYQRTHLGMPRYPLYTY